MAALFSHRIRTMPHTHDLASEYKSDPRSTEELIALAVAKDMDIDNEEYWRPIRILQHRLSDEFERIRGLSCSPNLKEQDVSATILGQNSVKDKYDVQRCQFALGEMLSRPDINSPPLASILFALGHLKAPGYIAMLLRFQGHADAEVRYAVTTSLGGSDEERAIDALIKLSRDDDFEVRNWATFGLGSLTETDSEDIRRALVDRLSETDDEIRGEALVGLVSRHDTRAIEPLRKEVNRWREKPLIKDCADKLVEEKEKYGPEWTPVFCELELASFRTAD
jgi:hypothetical protein